MEGIIVSGPVGRTLNTIYDHTACKSYFTESLSLVAGSQGQIINAVSVEYCRTQPTANLVAYYGSKLRGVVVADNLLTIPYLFMMGGVNSTNYPDYALLFNHLVLKCKTQPIPVRCVTLSTYLISTEFTGMSVYLKNLISVKYQGKMTVFN